MPGIRSRTTYQVCLASGRIHSQHLTLIQAAKHRARYLSHLGRQDFEAYVTATEIVEGREVVTRVEVEGLGAWS